MNQSQRLAEFLEGNLWQLPRSERFILAHDLKIGRIQLSVGKPLTAPLDCSSLTLSKPTTI